MFDNLSGLAIGLVVFTIVITVGIVVITNLGNSVGGSANVTASTLAGYLGTSSGGLGSWTLAIIALAVGMLFIGALMGKRKY
jgi:hypothetical protein